MSLGDDRPSGPSLPTASRAARRHTQDWHQWRRFGVAAGIIVVLELAIVASQAVGILGGEGSHPQAVATPSLAVGGGRASATGAEFNATATTAPPTTATRAPTTTEALPAATVPPTPISESPTTTTVALTAPGLSLPPQPTPTPAPLPAANDTETSATDIVNATNQDRAAHGLAMLTADPQLTSLAQSWAEHLATIGALVHQDLDTLRATSLANWQSLGENTLDGPEYMSASDMESEWLADEGHRENILRPQMNFVGVGVARDGAGRVWVVVDFGRR